MPARHIEGDPSRDLAGFLESLLPATDHRAHVVDVEIEHTRMVLGVQLGDGGLADARRTVEVDQSRRSTKNAIGNANLGGS